MIFTSNIIFIDSANINNCVLDNSDLDQKLAELENLPNIDMDELEKLELQQKELEKTDAGMKIFLQMIYLFSLPRSKCCNLIG